MFFHFLPTCLWRTSVGIVGIARRHCTIKSILDLSLQEVGVIVITIIIIIIITIIIILILILIHFCRTPSKWYPSKKIFVAVECRHPWSWRDFSTTCFLGDFLVTYFANGMVETTKPVTIHRSYGIWFTWHGKLFQLMAGGSIYGIFSEDNGLVAGRDE